MQQFKKFVIFIFTSTIYANPWPVGQVTLSSGDGVQDVILTYTSYVGTVGKEGGSPCGPPPETINKDGKDIGADWKEVKTYQTSCWPN
jgi:hypothetical protein